MRIFTILACFMLLSFQNIFAQPDCTSAVVICGNTEFYNPSGVGTKLEQLACGGIEHNSVWFAFQAKASGKLNFVIRPVTPAGLPTAVDIDWSVFALAGAPNSGNCDARTQLSCNFAGSGTVFGIPGATGMGTPPFAASQFNPGIDVVLGNWYAIIVDQFSNTTPLLFSIQFTGNDEYSAINSTPAIFDNRPNFTITNTSTTCGGSYSFTNTSSATSGIASYLWDFGDGSTSTLASPSKTYLTTGTYYVSLTVTDNNGCKSTIRKSIIYNNASPTLTAASIFATPSCSNANNGTLTVTTAGATTLGVTGGSAPYTFELVSPSTVIRASQSSNVFSGLPPGGYFVKATDACGKSAVSTVITIAQVVTNSTIGLGIQNTQAACNGTPSDTATIFANGSAPPYTIALVNSSPVTTGALPAVQRDPVTATYYTTFTNLLPGLYTVEAVDGCGKLRRATFTVGTSIAPTVSPVASPSCASTPTGTLSVTATAATGLSATGAPGTFQYALIAPSPIIRPFQTSSFFQNLFPGTYTVAVRDICGNIGTATAVIAAAPAPNFGTSFTSISCPNGNTGTIEVQNGTIAGGGSPYTFELIAPSPVTRAAQNDNAFTNLPPGTYTVRLTDVCGTSVRTTVTVAAAAAPTFTTTLTASCTSPASGTITVTPGALAIGPFSFELISPGGAIRAPQGSNIANTPNSIFIGLAPNPYTVKMTDGCGVPVTAAAIIAAPTALAFPNGSTVVPSCAASSTGQLTVATPTSGLGAYRYEIIAPSPVTRGQQYSRIFNNLPTGNYTIRITDSCGTQVDNSATPITLPVATAPTLSASNTASCALASGTITCLSTTANQGGGAYQFSLIAPSPVTRPNQTAPIFTGLPAGSYTVQITDQCGVTGNVNTVIAAAGAFTPAAGGSIVACNGSGYFAQIIVTTPQNFTTGGPIPTGSGGGPYTYAVYDATNTTLVAGPQAANIFSTIIPVAGTPSHTVRVADVCGNVSITTVNLNPPAALAAATITAATASCAASNTGVIRVTTLSTGGLPPYSYTLIDAITTAVVAGPQTSTTFNDVPANATGFLVRTTDACGNTVTSATAVLFPASVVPTATVVTTASCATPSTGRIVTTPGTGATLAGGTFSYALYDASNTILVAPSQASPVFSNLDPANYTVRIIDRCGNVGTVAATVASGAAALTSAGTVTGTCTGGATGVISGTYTGGSLPLTYSLVNQVTSTVVAGPQSDSVFSSLAAGTYIVRVTDACGTVANSADIVLADLLTTPTISTTSATDCSGFVLVSGYGGGGNGGPYIYAICSGAGCTSFGAYSSNNKFNITTDGTYRIAVRDRCGNQTSSADIVVTIPTKGVMTGVTKANACGNTTITPTFTNIPNTAYFSVDGANFSTTLGTFTPGCHSIRVADFNAGVFGCASDAFDFSVYQVPNNLTAPTAGNVNCLNGNVTLSVTGGTLGCGGSGASAGISLISCVGCTGGADPIGTVKTGPSATFNLIGASSAQFAPAIVVGGSAVCTGANLNVDFAGNYCFGSALPVQIEYFRGNRANGNHLLNWKVNCTQSPSATLVLERSNDGRNFTAIQTLNVDAPRCLQPFNYTDAQPLSGMNYYRLKMTDASGNSSYSIVVTLLNRQNGWEILNIIPNPVTKSGAAILNITSAVQTPVEFVVSDAAGKRLLVFDRTLIAGANQVALDLGQLAPGVYQITGYGQNKITKTVRFVRQ
ncbi:MAG: PKD domain-containing protein [Ferruginibacter sp.]